VKLQRRASARDEKLQRRAAARDLERGELKGVSLDSGTAFGFTGRGMGTSLDAGTNYETESVEEAQDDSEEVAFKSIQRLEQRLDKSVSIVI